MSDLVRINLSRISLLVGVVGGLGGMLGAFVLLPYRMEAAERKADVLERKIEVMEQKLEAHRELLVRIDENVKTMKERAR